MKVPKVPQLGFNPGYPFFTALGIFAMGTVMNADVTITATLTPTDATGASNGTPLTNSQVVSGTSWIVFFFPAPFTLFSGYYQLEIQASDLETPISQSGFIPPI